jgi:hypothetical protein
VTRDRTHETAEMPPHMRQFPLELFNVSRAAKQIQDAGHRGRSRVITFPDRDPMEGIELR